MVKAIKSAGMSMLVLGVMVLLLPRIYWQAYKGMRQMERDGVIIKEEDWGECVTGKEK